MRPTNSPKPGFATTQWTVFQAARDDRCPESGEALAALCRTYWLPVYAYLRRRGSSVSEAEDLTQGFVSSLLENRAFQAADRSRGRFRVFLLASLRHYLAGEWHRRQAHKRGGGKVFLDIDVADAESRYAFDRPGPASPERLFERRWALGVLGCAIGRLRRELEESPDPVRSLRLMQLITTEGDDEPYRSVAAELGMSTGAVKVAVHRLRRRHAAMLREEVARTVDDPARVDDELRYLFSCLEPC